MYISDCCHSATDCSVDEGCFINSTFMSPLLQSAEKVFSPPSFSAGKLLLPFLIVQVMEKSSMPPKTVPRILPFFAVSEIDFPTFIFSHTISPPFAFRLILSVKDSGESCMFSFVVFAENAEIKLSGTRICILRYSSDGFTPIKSVQFLLYSNFTSNSLPSVVKEIRSDFYLWNCVICKDFWKEKIARKY